MPESDPFLRTLAQCYEAYTGQKGQCLAIGGGTYVHDIPGGVAFGPNMPGFVSNLHGPDERSGWRTCSPPPRSMPKSWWHCACEPGPFLNAPDPGRPGSSQPQWGQASPVAFFDFLLFRTMLAIQWIWFGNPTEREALGFMTPEIIPLGYYSTYIICIL